MPINVVYGSSLEFVAALIDAQNNYVVVPIGIYMTIKYTDKGGSSQATTFLMRGFGYDYVGYWSLPSSAAKVTMPIMLLSLSASGAIPISPPDPYLRIVG